MQKRRQNSPTTRQCFRMESQRKIASSAQLYWSARASLGWGVMKQIDWRLDREGRGRKNIYQSTLAIIYSFPLTLLTFSLYPPLSLSHTLFLCLCLSLSLSLSVSLCLCLSVSVSLSLSLSPSLSVSVSLSFCLCLCLSVSLSLSLCLSRLVHNDKDDSQCK